MAKGRHKRREAKKAPTGQSPLPAGPPAGTGRRWARTILLSAVALAVLTGGWYLWGWLAAPAAPAIAFTDADPAVVSAIEAARRDVWWRPRSAAAWGRLGQVLSAHGYKSEANRCFAEAERLAPDEPRWPYLQGALLQSDDPPAALRHLQRAVELCDGVPDAPRLLLAELCLQQGRLDEAEGHFRQVLRRDSGNARAHLGLGRLADERGNPRDGLAHLKRSASSRLTQKASCIVLARVYHQLGDKPAADRERARALELPADPPWPDPFLEEVQSLMIGKQARLARLQTLHRQGRVEEARAYAQQLEMDYPDVYWLVEGRGLIVKGDLPAAEQALRKAIELAPESVDAHFDLGNLLFERRDYPAAAQCFHRVTELEPSYGPAYQRLGRCWLQQGERAAALRPFQAAVRYMPQNAEARRELGEVLAREGRAAEAAAELRQALLLQPGDAKAKELLEEVSRKATEK